MSIARHAAAGTDVWIMFEEGRGALAPESPAWGFRNQQQAQKDGQTPAPTGVRIDVIDQVGRRLRDAPGPHDKQKSRRLGLKAISLSWQQPPQRRRRKPWARMPD